MKAQGKHTPGVRKILQSQKTFGNHLDDFLALQALAESNPAGGSRSNAAGGGAGSKKSGSSRRDREKDSNTSSSARQGQDQDTQMTDANLPPVIPPSYKPLGQQQTSEQDDAEAKAKADNQEGGSSSELFLESRVPAMPTDEELRRLLAAPALSYGEATGNWEEKYPTRAFCEVCGYWGRVRCMKCGTRVCALDCLELHREECVTRYGL